MQAQQQAQQQQGQQMMHTSSLRPQRQPGAYPPMQGNARHDGCYKSYGAAGAPATLTGCCSGGFTSSSLRSSRPSVAPSPSQHSPARPLP
mmetsp:Transcript_40887/g.96231  ORF Transcript_40887/g.96231 Transcript_40887/m.96231 type:complete len:90 (+) Transcript_40887:2-271(+)